MKPIDSGGHAAYRNFLQENFLKFYPNPQNISESTWQVIEKFWNLDLSEVNSQMSDLYSKCGPKPRLPSDMLRSLLVSVEFKIDSYTKWSYQLKINPLFALLTARNLSGNCRKGMTLQSGKTEQSFRVVRGRGFPLPERF